MKHIKWIVIGLVAVLAFVAFCNLLPDTAPPKVLIDTWSSKLTERGYRQAENKKPDNIPADKTPPAGDPILYASGQAEGDNIEIIGVTTPDGNFWLTGTIKGLNGVDRQIIFDTLQWHDQIEIATSDRSDFSLITEAAWIDNRVDAGAGLAWDPVQVWNINAGLFGTVDINQDILTAPDWAAAGGRLSTDLWIFTAGLDIGYRIGESPGLHTGAGIGVRIGF